jgi:hypothetical protein
MNQTIWLEGTLSASEMPPAGVSQWAGTPAYWQNRPQGATDSQTQNIAKNLAEWRPHLLGGNFDARAIGALLVRLGRP